MSFYLSFFLIYLIYLPSWKIEIELHKSWKFTPKHFKKFLLKSKNIPHLNIFIKNLKKKHAKQTNKKNPVS